MKNEIVRLKEVSLKRTIEILRTDVWVQRIKIQDNNLKRVKIIVLGKLTGVYFDGKLVGTCTDNEDSIREVSKKVKNVCWLLNRFDLRDLIKETIYQENKKGDKNNGLSI